MRLLFICAGALCVAATAGCTGPDPAGAVPTVSDAPRERLPRGFDEPVPLTSGEEAELRYLVPGIDPKTVPLEMASRIRAIMYTTDGYSKKSYRLRSLLR